MNANPTRDSERDVSPRAVKGLLQGLAVAIALWCVFFALWAVFPLIRPGNNQIYSEKLSMVAHEQLFRDNAEVKLVLSGNSRILSGFKPELFHRRSQGRVSAFNLGLPDANHFIEELETLVERGEVPTHVFLTVPWATEAAPSGFDLLFDDDRLMDTLFPFRRFLRDLTLFTIRSVSRGGPVAYYRKAQEYKDQMRVAGGYFFIEGQSHHPGHRLPEGFTLDSDDPTVPIPRRIRMEGPVFERLIELRDAAGFRVYFVPYYIRATASAPAGSNVETARALRSVGIEVLGPDYWVYPNRFFSDPLHLNPLGAECYSTQLWKLTRSVLVGPAFPDSPIDSSVHADPCADGEAL